MTREEAAAALNGCEYGNEGSKELFAQMKADGLVAVFGASDDLMEFAGAIRDEVDCYGGGTAYVTDAGLFEKQCENDHCPHEVTRQGYATPIEAKFGQNGMTFQYETAIPHSTFLIWEDVEPYCEGIVFALSDVPS